MNVLVIGDIHGCYHTLKELVDLHWNKDKEFLVLVGDLVNKGMHSVPVIQYVWKLQEKYPYQVFCVRGNNEQYLLDSYKHKVSAKWYNQFKGELKEQDISMGDVANWVESTPLKWETPHVLITHAGVAKGVKYPFYIIGQNSVINNRDPLKNVGKVQIHGHDMIRTGKAQYNKDSHSWNIDTGVWLGNNLTGIRLNRKGKMLELIEVKSHPMDRPVTGKK